MSGLVRRLVTTIVARIDSIADRDPDPDALTGRTSSRRHGRPVRPASADTGPADTGPAVDAVTSEGEKHRRDTPSVDRTPEEAQHALDALRADQHRRMRGRGWLGSGDRRR